MLHGHWGGSSIAAGGGRDETQSHSIFPLYLVLGFPPPPRGIEESSQGHAHIPFLQLGEAAEKMGAQPSHMWKMWAGPGIPEG